MPLIEAEGQPLKRGRSVADLARLIGVYAYPWKPQRQEAVSQLGSPFDSGIRDECILPASCGRSLATAIRHADRLRGSAVEIRRMLFALRRTVLDRAPARRQG